MVDLIACGVDTAMELGHTTSLHVRRLTGIITLGAGRIGREVQDMVWNCRDVLEANCSRGHQEPDAVRGMAAVDLSPVGSSVDRVD